MSSKDPLHFFDILKQIGFSKSPFHNFRLCEIFQNYFFVLKLGFLNGPAQYIRTLFFKAGVFSLRLFSNLFLSKPVNFTRNETFCEHTGLFRVFGTLRYFPKEKKMDFSLLAVGDKVVFELMFCYFCTLLNVNRIYFTTLFQMFHFKCSTEKPVLRTAQVFFSDCRLVVI